jgi:ABC-type nitrate/sulfonate/bicarbonate transport system substrate-binding protein
MFFEGKTAMKALKIFFALLLIWGIASSFAHAADKVVISYSSRSFAFLPAQVAVARGFFRDENLEPLLIQMRSQVTVPALMSGEVHYTLSFGNIIGSAMQGMPFKILAVLTDKPLHSIVARPEIKSIKIFAASGSARSVSAVRINWRRRRYCKPRDWI